MAKYRPRGKLGDRGGLTDARGADERGNAAADGIEVAAAGADVPRQDAQRQVTRLLGRHAGRKLGAQRAGHVAIDTQAGHLAQHAGTQRLVAVHLVPRQRRELHFQHLAQVVDLGAYAVHGGVVVRRYGRGADHIGDARGERGARLTLRRGGGGRGALRGALDGGGRGGAGLVDARGALEVVALRTDRRFLAADRGRLDTEASLAHQCFVVIEGGDDLDAVVHATRRQDHRVGTLLVTDLAHGLAHVGSNESFDFHAFDPVFVRVPSSRTPPCSSGRPPESSGGVSLLSSEGRHQLDAPVVRNLVVGEYMQVLGHMAHEARKPWAQRR